MPDSSATLLIAAITGAFGARGEIRVKSFTDDPAACLSYGPFVDEHGTVILKISKSRAVKGGFAVRSPSVQYRDQAEALRGTKLYCLRASLPSAQEGEYYHSDLIGMAVISGDDQPLGTVMAVHNYGASDLLEITNTPGVQDSWNVPFTISHVPKVDLAGATVILADWQDYLPEVKTSKKPGHKNGKKHE